LEPHDYEVLLIVAGLASYNRYGFKMKPTAWRTFLGSHHFMNYDIVIEFEPKKINLEAYVIGVRPSRTSMKTFYAIRIGTKIEGSPNKIEDQIGRDGRLVTTPSRLNLMRIKTQSFKEIAAQYLWQYAIDNEEEEVTRMRVAKKMKSRRLKRSSSKRMLQRQQQRWSRQSKHRPRRSANLTMMFR